MSFLTDEIKKRRTFAIISHPDAGKTTLTEKLLLYGGAIHLAGAVRAKANQRHTTSDWMEIERQRGISVSSSVLQFEYQGHCINLLDTPGHKDFSEDTYRTLVAADAAVMLIDAAKGVEEQTRKLFEVCRLRGIPIFTFINKMDRPCRDPFDLLSEIEKVLNIESFAMNWPIGLGDQFSGIFDRTLKTILLFENENHANIKVRLEAEQLEAFEFNAFWKILQHSSRIKNQSDAQELFEALKAQLELLDGAGGVFNTSKMLQGELSPVFFGSAMNNFGIQNFLNQFIALAPPPSLRKTTTGNIEPSSQYFSCFVFKIQANMNKSHRDRVAFLRVCSGKFERHMLVHHHRLQQKIKLSHSLTFFAQERVTLEEAWPGDIIGILDTNNIFRIGDTLSTNKTIAFDAVPSFSPEHFCLLRLSDPMKRKQLKKGLQELSEEGIIQIYLQPDLGEQDPIIAAVGALQFEVLEYRLKNEYNAPISRENLPYVCARWMIQKKPEASLITPREDIKLVYDQNHSPVLLFKSNWALRWTTENYPQFYFSPTATL